MDKMLKLKKENQALKETCQILSDKKILKKIEASLVQIRSGKFISADRL